MSYTRIAPDKGFLVSTNINAGRYETGDGYCRRNEAAKQILATLNTGAELSVDLMVSVLRATSADQRYKTLYSAVYDLPEQRIHLYVQRQFLQPIVFDVAQELAKVVHPKQYRIVPLEDVVVEARSTGK